MAPLPPDATPNATDAVPAQAIRSKVATFDNSAAVRSARDVEKTFVPPTFTIKELRDVIPAHCFERSTLRSSLYVLMDVTAVCLTGTAIWFVDNWLDSIQAPAVVKFAAWALYSFVQGIFGTGLWVLAHECGHQAFSPSTTINYAVGYVLHTFLLVPFHSWRISHAMHHAHTAHMEKDQVFVPKTRAQRGLKEVDEVATSEDYHDSVFQEAPLYSIFNIIGMLLFGWILYLTVNASGQNYGRWTSHFHPSSPIFKETQRKEVIASTIGIVGMLGLLGLAAQYFGFSTVVLYYGLPYLWVNAWLVTITFLQHTDPVLPHYREPSWNFVRGALATVDRDFGWILNACLHHIHDTHVCHHLFSRLPHYHAVEATRYLKEKLGPEYYVFDRTPIWKALYRSWRQCAYVENTGDVLFFRGVGEYCGPTKKTE
jgi:omega-6 fatty acid desaturase (delta-12 desaturase)